MSDGIRTGRSRSLRTDKDRLRPTLGNRDFAIISEAAAAQPRIRTAVLYGPSLGAHIMRLNARSLSFAIAVTAALTVASAPNLQAQAGARTERGAATEQGREYHLLLSADHASIAAHAAVLAELGSSVTALNIRVARQLVDEMTTELADARIHHAEIDTALVAAKATTVHAIHTRLITRHDAITATLGRLRAALALPPLDVDRPTVARDAARIYWEAKGAEAANGEVRGMRGMRALVVPKRPS